MAERKSDDLVRHAGALLKMAAGSLGMLREVAVRSTQAGYLRMDVALLYRERREELAALGAAVAELIESGQLEVPRHVRAVYDRVREIDTRIGSVSMRVHDNAFGARRGYEPEAGDYPEDYDGEGDGDGNPH
jgi:hypothetical protein